MFEAYDITSCDMSCDCNVTCLFIITKKKKKKKRNIKSRKIDKRKMLVSKAFHNTKDIGSGAFELELPEEWMIHNVFNENLLT